MVLVDSHCHLNHLDLTQFNHSMDEVMQAARANDVGCMLSVSVCLGDYPLLQVLSEKYPHVFISVGVHPTEEIKKEPLVEDLVQLAKYPRCVAIGETGLDYYHVQEAEGQANQKNRFRQHIRASLASSKPLIIHTRQAPEDTLQIMREEKAEEIGGVMHCFSESWDMAKKAIDMNFYISLSGIVTFKNAVEIHKLAKKIPLDRLLIETDAPYLAPVPFRGKQNHPALVRHVAQAIADLRGVEYLHIAQQTTENFYRCFNITF